MKGLVYYVIGDNPEYAKLLKYSINTLRCYIENDKYDILIMCDESYLPNVKDFPVNHIAVTKPNLNSVSASLRKVEIFDFHGINNYDKILYLDCDTVICGSLDPIFDIISNPDLLYVSNESKDIEDFIKYPYFQRKDKQYDELVLEIFKQKGIFPFNAGQFGFCVSNIMKYHFNNLKRECGSYNVNEHFYEQSFMNEYFCTRFIVSYDLNKHCYFNADISIFNTNLLIVNHFIGYVQSYTKKLSLMQDFHYQYISNIAKNLIVNLDTRDDMSSIIKLEQDARILEIGCLRGDFTQNLFDMFKPAKLYMVDPWINEDVVSGDKNGNNMVLYNGEDNYHFISERFRNNPNIQVIRKFSFDITYNDIPANSLSMIYVDGDHSYEGVKIDLMLCLKLLKKNGIICGHDYAVNKAKTNGNFNFGVKQAVDEFCKEQGYRIWAFMNDGCMSYCIRT